MKRRRFEKNLYLSPDCIERLRSGTAEMVEIDLGTAGVLDLMLRWISKPPPDHSILRGPGVYVEVRKEKR